MQLAVDGGLECRERGGGADEEDRKEGHMRGIVQEEGEVYCVWVNRLD